MRIDSEIQERIQENIKNVTKRIEKACKRCGRSPSEVTLIGVTKTVDIAKIYAAVNAGLHVFGENYIQEAKRKISEIKEPVEWHFIGRLQRNKAKYAVRLFDIIHTVDSIKLAAELQKRAESANKKQPLLVEVNMSGETSKAGVSPSNLKDLLKFISRTTHLQIRGLMTMPPYFSNPEKARPYFIKLRKIREEMTSEFPDLPLKDLSMGMSGDFEVAVEEGATMIRVGTAIFGKRN